jgi:sphinganine-1-phosphate aldolase
MSVDTHKFGYSLKGISVVLYRTPDLRRAQYFCCPKFPGGLYSTPAIAGSRSSGLIVQCWASMIHLGESGYLRHTSDILQAVSTIHQGIVTSIPELEIMGRSEAMIVCFRSSSEETIKTYAVGYKMVQKGWGLNLLQYPIGIHLCCTVQTVGHEEDFLSDLKEVIKEIRVNGEGHIGGTAAVYGSAAVFPAGPVEEVMKGYQDAIYRV